MKMSFDNIDKVQDDVIGHDEFAAWFLNHGVNSITIKVKLFLYFKVERL